MPKLATGYSPELNFFVIYVFKMQNLMRGIPSSCCGGGETPGEGRDGTEAPVHTQQR